MLSSIITDLKLFEKNYFKYIKEFFSRYKKLTILTILFSFLTPIFEGLGLGTFLLVFQFAAVSGTNANQNNYFFMIFETLKNQYSMNGDVLIVIFSLLFLFLLILKNYFMFLSGFLSAKMHAYIDRDLKIDLFNSLFKSNAKLFNNKSSDLIIGAIHHAAYTGRFMYYFLLAMLALIRGGVLFFGLIFISFELSAIVLVLILLFIFPLKSLIDKFRALGSEDKENINNYVFRITEIFNNFSLIKFSGTEEHEHNNLKRITNKLASSSCLESKYSFLLPGLMECMVGLFIVLFFLSSVFLLKIDISTNYALTLAYLFVFYRLYAQINLFYGFFAKLQVLRSSFNYYFDLIKNMQISEIVSGKIQPAEFKQRILFENVGFSYNKNKQVLHNLNFSIQKGTFVALVGRTGSGKTTIIRLLSGLYHVDEGKIYVDNFNLNEIDLNWWRNRLGFVLQDTMILNDTIKNNIRYGNFNLTDEEILDMAKLIGIDKFILELPNGYDTILGEKGFKLSGGQKQLISIARAIARKPDILIFDEATSSLDNQTEKLIQEAITLVSKKYTLIVIAHRLSTILNADKIFVLNEGKIAEEGTSKELLGKNGIYKNLYKLQFEKKSS